MLLIAQPHIASAQPAPGSIGDFVWLDTNVNGVQDAGEAGFAGVTVGLADENYSTIATATTDANGLYSFFGLTAGSYRLYVVLPLGYAFTVSNIGSDLLDSDFDYLFGSGLYVLASGQTITTVDAGLCRAREDNLKTQSSCETSTVPEPPGLVLLAMGLALLAGFGFDRFKKAHILRRRRS